MDVIEKNTVDITPDVSLMPKLGHSGYKIVEAISEFIDNCIDAKLRDEALLIGIDIDEMKLVVRDNASGMDSVGLANALRLAYTVEHKKKRLGQFGLGLKTAATSLGKKFTIKTTKSGDKYWYILVFDEDEWLKSNKWESEILTEPKNDLQIHGTTITIERVKYRFYPNQVTNIKRDISFRFASFIGTKELKIRVNSQLVNKPIIELRNDESFPVEIQLDEKRKITGWYGYLVKRSRQHYGFNLYKNERLIAPYQKIGFEPHPEAALLYGELYLDFVPVTHNKREFIQDSVDFLEARDAIAKFLRENRVVVRSREISKNEIVNNVADNIRKKLTSLQLALGKRPLIENVSSFKTHFVPETELTDKHSIKTITLSQSFKPDKLNEDRPIEFKIENEKFYIDFGLAPLGKDEEWVKYFVKGNNITVLINIDFPLYSMVRSYQYYSLILIAEAMAEFVIKKYELPKNSAIYIRNRILRRVGEAQMVIEKDIAMQEEAERLAERMNKIKEERTQLRKSLISTEKNPER
jgi:hypothetical protein